MLFICGAKDMKVFYVTPSISVSNVCRIVMFNVTCWSMLMFFDVACVECTGVLILGLYLSG